MELVTAWVDDDQLYMDQYINPFVSICLSRSMLNVQILYICETAAWGPTMLAAEEAHRSFQGELESVWCGTCSAFETCSIHTHIYNISIHVDSTDVYTFIRLRMYYFVEKFSEFVEATEILSQEKGTSSKEKEEKDNHWTKIQTKPKIKQHRTVQLMGFALISASKGFLRSLEAFQK